MGWSKIPIFYPKIPKSIEVRKKTPNLFVLLLLVYFFLHSARIFSSHYTLLKLTESNNDGHYSSARRSLQHGVSRHTKQCGWLRYSALIQRWSSRPAVPLSFNDNWSIFCCFLFLFVFLQFGMKTLIYQTQTPGELDGAWDGKSGMFPTFFLPLPLFSQRVL